MQLNEDEAGPYQAIPQPGASWQPDGHPATQPHEYERGGTAKLLTLFRPSTGQVRAKGVIEAPNTVLHPWLQEQLSAVLAEIEKHQPTETLPPEEKRPLYARWETWLGHTPGRPLPPLRILLVLDNLAGHLSSDLVRWFFDHGVMPLYTPIGGSWLNMAESVQRIIVRRALSGQYPQNTQEVIDWLPTPHNLAVNRVLQGLDTLVRRIIAEHRSTGKDTGDLLSLLLLAQDEDGSQMSDQQLHDEVLTLLLGGHETTANALVWACWRWSQHPEVAQKLREEVDSVLGQRAPKLEDFPRLQYVDMVIKETLRVYPPAWILGRQAMQDVELGGYHVRKGTMVFVSPYVQHHDPRWFEEPEEFHPEHFSEEKEKKIRAYAYIPFGAGPRACIGSRFTLTERKVVLTLLAQKCQLTLAPNQKVEMEPLITVRPKGGMSMIISKR